MVLYRSESTSTFINLDNIDIAFLDRGSVSLQIKGVMHTFEQKDFETESWDELIFALYNNNFHEDKQEERRGIYQEKLTECVAWVNAFDTEEAKYILKLEAQEHWMCQEDRDKIDVLYKKTLTLY